jgi:hypothetical protein
MPFKFRPIILLLALALLIQNTCPFGTAGKSTVSHACGHCQMKHAVTAPPIGQKQLVSDSSSVHFPLYVFAVPKTVHTFQLSPVKSARPVLADFYQDAQPDGLLKPPQA